MVTLGTNSYDIFAQIQRINKEAGAWHQPKYRNRNTDTFANQKSRSRTTHDVILQLCMLFISILKIIYSLFPVSEGYSSRE